jgi:hypothetical protein
MKFDLPVNFKIEAKDEKDAEVQLNKLLRKAVRRYGLEEVLDYEYFEFLDGIPSCSGCGNNDCCQGQSIQCN